MNLLFKLAAAALLHALFFACYPDTGPFGNYYLGISLLVWAGFLAFVSTGARLVRFFSGAAGALISLAAFAVMGLALAATMPQADKVSVLEKLQAGKYPDRSDLDRGLERFGIDLDKELKHGEKELRKQAAEAVQNAQKELK
ncbi:MAG: hypothetical protein A2107_03770 [Verrucomicrobia bacterium GWF2_62_7]|nr:MAG: hypothetical protein A2X32_09220 [Elusimicrobia bacterium GWC2_64_44]OHE82917.1 MAG: hypothetical protein A2107_03770 [Verrucomicrobia bacterium GWF2_62_7]